MVVKVVFLLFTNDLILLCYHIICPSMGEKCTETIQSVPETVIISFSWKRQLKQKRVIWRREIKLARR